ncbi:hypothetical protein D3X44_16575 [Acinetobacter baumannii]|nr:hypothetical protein D3X44_16575 [Acinetobacter baumannii]RJO39105.1 hypothetical protein D3X45_17090 [Acinetobacter baumannii]
MDNVAQLETDTNFQSRKKITWGVFSVLLLFLVAGILYYFFVYRANSNMRCDSLKSLMIINKLSKFL